MQQGESQQKDTLPGQVTVNLGENGIQPYPATLDYFAPNVDLNTGTLNLRARLDNPKGLLKSGLYVSITLPYGKESQAVLVSEASIGTDQLIDDTLRQVTGGLSPKERYVTKALMKVREGMRVKPISK